MAKEKERRIARILYVEHNKTAKEVAFDVGVTEKTLGDWVDKFGWKAERNAKLNNAKTQVNNIKSVINALTEERLDNSRKLEEETEKDIISELRKDIARIDSAIANWNKTLNTMDKENKISLSTYLHVMERVFNSFQKDEPKLYLKTLQFQEDHVQQISQELG